MIGGRFSTDPNALTSGEEVFSRLHANGGVVVTQSRAMLTFFTSRKTETITKVRTITGSTAAAATPTLCRVGIYSVDGSGNGTLVASIANDTTLWATANTAYSSTLSSPLAKVGGQRYALGIICVTGAAAPSFIGAGVDGSPGYRTEMTIAPRIAGFVNSVSDLPASFTDAGLSIWSLPLYGVLVP